MMKQILKFSMVFAFAMAAFFTSCDKSTLTTQEGVFEFTDEAMFTLQESGSIGRKGCFELVFPITIEFPDSTTADVNDYDELRTAIKEWKEANPDAQEKPNFVFPIEVISEDGEVISVANKAELFELKKDCKGNFNRPKGHKCKPCFELVFPLTIEFPDGTTQEVADRSELKTTIREWKQNNQGSDERPAIVFPIDVEMEDGTIVPVNSKEELKELRESCGDD
ncbi:MAG: hypothetical protein NXI23_02880 [Bacteroidetes bacterium]|nr:hypothetical protein [Bacteroidota bacterium]